MSEDLTEHKAMKVFWERYVLPEARVTLDGLAKTVEQRKTSDEAGGWVMRQAYESAPIPVTDETWPVRVGYSFEASS